MILLGVRSLLACQYQTENLTWHLNRKMILLGVNSHLACQNRTENLTLKRRLLCQLSYRTISACNYSTATREKKVSGMPETLSSAPRRGLEPLT